MYDKLTLNIYVKYILYIKTKIAYEFRFFPNREIWRTQPKGN